MGRRQNHTVEDIVDTQVIASPPYPLTALDIPTTATKAANPALKGKFLSQRHPSR